MSAVAVPLRFQIGARTLAAIPRRLVRVPLSLAQALEGTVPALPPLESAAHGYLVTSLPLAAADVLEVRVPHLIAWRRQHYIRYWADLTIGVEAYEAALSGQARSALRRKAKRIAAESGGALDVRRYRTPDEIATFHAIAHDLSRKTYQHRLMGGGLPADPAFTARMQADAAAGQARGWLLFLRGEAIAYLYCPIVGGDVIYDHVGHDPAFAALSPGSVLHHAAMRDLLGDDAARRFDFTEGEGQHKRQLATGGIACVDQLLLRPTLANRAALGALRGFDRAAAAAKAVTLALRMQGIARHLRR